MAQPGKLDDGSSAWAISPASAWTPFGGLITELVDAVPQQILAAL